MQEEWRSVDGYEQYYQISNTGKVKSLKRANRGVDMIMTPVRAGGKPTPAR
jgi:hypothetical protein